MSSAPPRATGAERPTTESPCIKVCSLDSEQRCRGCGRTIDEIAGWSSMTAEQRIAINARVGFVSHRPLDSAAEPSVP